MTTEKPKEYLHYDTDGALVCKYVKSGAGKWVLLLEQGYMLVQDTVTKEFGIWGGKNRKLVEFKK